MLEAAKQAGYSDGTPVASILRGNGVSKKLIEVCFEWAALHLPQALKGVVDVLNNPVKPGAKNVIAAANTIMDRGGLAKAEKLNIETDGPNAVIILPAKGSIKPNGD